ncbi:MAG: hypothetical protein IT168_30575 [Bryobacterales bacterium]|nr:hypothetical protein [Bryobacterales bacterium]
MSRFLRVLVEHTLLHGDAPSARDIAKLVFDKEGFRSRTDPIVRVEARRLRNMLRTYYEKAGPDDKITISLAERGYKPRFSPRGADTKPASQSDTTPDPLDRSIVVLPFLNMTADDTQQSFCEGLTQEVINALTRVPHIKVVSRTSAFQFKDAHDVRTIARDLGAGAILEGSVRMEESDVRVTAQLTGATDGFHVWSESFDGKLGSTIALQESLATQISTAIEHEL